MDRRRWLWLLAVGIALGFGPALAAGVTVRVGAGQDTTVLSGFFPETVRIQVGDTVTWKFDASEFHTVSFLGGGAPPPFLIPVPDDGEGRLMFNPQVAFPTRAPGAPAESYSGSGFVGSGLMSLEPAAPDMPPNSEFTLTFTEPGVYDYLDLVFGVRGRVEVLAAGSSGIDAQAALDARAQEEIAALMAMVDAARAQGQSARALAGPNGTTLWFVRAGAVDGDTGDIRAQLFEFLPKDLTIKAGDTVIWASPFIHTVTFVPLPPTPEAVIETPQGDGPPQLILNPLVFAPSEPAASYDPMQYFNSGAIGTFSPAGLAWALTFEQPGSYEYVCAIHEGVGMKGMIIVESR